MNLARVYLIDTWSRSPILTEEEPFLVFFGFKLQKDLRNDGERMRVLFPAGNEIEHLRKTTEKM